MVTSCDSTIYCRIKCRFLYSTRSVSTARLRMRTSARAVGHLLPLFLTSRGFLASDALVPPTGTKNDFHSGGESVQARRGPIIVLNSEEKINIETFKRTTQRCGNNSLHEGHLKPIRPFSRRQLCGETTKRNTSTGVSDEGNQSFSSIQLLNNHTLNGTWNVVNCTCINR